ncbi:MAG: PIN domain-containing protein [Candidatus Nitrosocaldus sp.]
MQEKPKVYIDTSILISPFVDRQKRASEVRSKLIRISNNYTIVIPQIVIGESISVIIKKSGSKNSDILQEFINSILNYITDDGKLPALNKEILKQAIKLKGLQEGYHELDVCDCLIIAHAIVDKEAKYLLTYGSILENDVIMDYVKQTRQEYGYPPLIITDSLR